MTSAPKTPTRTPDVNGHAGRNGNGHHGQGPAGGDGPAEARPPGLPARRTSIFPLLLDVGLVMGAFGLIILRPLVGEAVGYTVVGVGVVLAVTALVGWLREARADYKQLSD